jgi:dihydroorotase
VATWIRGGDLVDPDRGVIKKHDLILDRGKIERILPSGVFSGGERIRIIDATGMILLPGLIDMHVHLREPGFEYKESISTGARAGVAGGFTAVACMPNTDPVNDSSSVTQFILRKAREAGLLRVYPVAAVTKGQGGEMLNDFGDLRAAGAVGISDDGLPVASGEVMRRALEYALYQGLTVISHCEDRSLSKGGVMHEGVVSTRIGLPGIPAASEEIMVFREVALARLTGCPVHIAHVSTAGSVAIIRGAKEEGIPITAETAPHYFTLDHNAVVGYDTHTKMNPPLRRREDVEAIKKGLAEGVLDVIATDHAPHSPLEKEVEFDKAAFGIIGLETALPLTLSLVRSGVLSMGEAVGKLSTRPASILGVDGGHLEEGGPADVTIIDPEVEYVLQADDIQSKSKNSPFLGMPLKGMARVTIVGGKIVWETKPGDPRR